MAPEETPYEEPNLYPSMQSMWPEWHAQARCLGDNDEVFFGSSTPSQRPAYTLTSIKEAQAKCYSCPVFEQCLRHAIKIREQYGVWAATTMKDRSRIFKMIDQNEATEDEIVDVLLRARP